MMNDSTRIGAIGSELEGMSLFLTGGTGFFGRALLRYIADSPIDKSTLGVTVLSRSPDTFLARYPEFSRLNWLDFHTGDILASPSILPVHARFSHILHAAADSTITPQGAPFDRYEQIVTGTRHLLDFAVRVGARRFLLTSSGAVYGAPPAGLDRVPEYYHGMPDPMVSDHAYGVAKRLAEHLCCLYQDRYGLETVVARCFAFIGPDLPLDAHFAIGNFIRDALFGKEVIVHGTGTPVRSYLYQDDLAEWLLTLLAMGEPTTAYNVGSDEAISIADLAYLIRDQLAPGKAVRIEGGSSADAPTRNRYVPNTDKASKDLGLHIKVPLAAAIRITAEAIGSRQNARSRQ